MPFESTLPVKTVYSTTDVIAPPPFGRGSGFVMDSGDDLSAPQFEGKIFPRDTWDDLAIIQETNGTSPYDFHKNGVNIYDQKSTNYCWCFGVCAGVATQYSKSGISIPDLSPASTACQIKDFNNVGGWGKTAVAGIQKYGIATTDTWPNVSFDRSLPANHDVIADSRQHGIAEFENLGSDFDAMISSLLDPVNPAPCSVGFSWWGHLVVALKAVKVDNSWGIIIANSWGPNWSDKGYGVLLGSKARADEAIRIGRVKPRS